MTTLVTGASGFIGRRLVLRLLERGARVRALSRTGTPPQGVSWPPGALEGVRVDLATASDLAAVCRGVETVFHLAGYAHAEEADREHAARLHQKITVGGTQALLDAAVAAGARRFVFASSVKAMGEGGARRARRGKPVPAGFGLWARQARGRAPGARGRPRARHAGVCPASAARIRPGE